jgi:hypothetical protein
VIKIIRARRNGQNPQKRMYINLDMRRKMRAQRAQSFLGRKAKCDEYYIMYLAIWNEKSVVLSPILDSRWRK